MWIISSCEIMNANELEKFHMIKSLFRKSEEIIGLLIWQILMQLGWVLAYSF